MTLLQRDVAEFRERLTDRGATFLLVYSVPDLIKDEVNVQITSNSSQFGIRAILSAIWVPTEAAVKILANALLETAQASLGTSIKVLDQAEREGAFLDAARVLFNKLRGSYTIKGWEQENPGVGSS